MTGAKRRDRSPPDGTLRSAAELAMEREAAPAPEAPPPAAPAPAPPPAEEVEAAASVRERLVRVLADYDNLRKRVERERADHRRAALAALFRSLLPVADHMERAIASSSADEGPLATGVRRIHAQLREAMALHGIVPVGAAGEPFDPAVHEAVVQRLSADAPPGTVLEVLAPGYRIDDLVLRPARVAVSVVSPPVRVPSPEPGGDPASKDASP